MPNGSKPKRPSKAKKEEDQTLSSMKATVIEKYNEVAKKRDWFLVDPEKRLPKATDDLMTKFLEKPEHFAQLDAYMEKLSCLDWVEAARIDFTLRTRTFNEVMSGEWAPREKQANGRHPPEEEESPEMRSARLEYEASLKKGSA